MKFPGRPVDDEQTERVAVVSLPAIAGAVASLVVVFWVLFPAISRGAFVGRASVDAWGTQWFYDWAGGLISGDTPGLMHSDALFYPWGKDIYAHTGGNVFDALLAWPFRAVFGEAIGYGLFIAVVMLCNGGAVAWVTRRLGAGRWGAALAGVLGVCNPFALHELQAGRPTQALLCFAFVAVGAAFVTWERWDPKIWLIGTVALALTGLTYWFNALFVGGAIGLLLPLALVMPGTVQVRKRRFGGLVGMLALSGVLVLPAIWPMLSAWSGGQVPGVLDTSLLSGSNWRPVTKEGFATGLHVLDLFGGHSGFFVPTDGGLAFVPGDLILPFAMCALLVVGAVRYRGGLRVPSLILIVFGLILAVGPQWRPELGPPNVAFVWLIDGLPLFDRLWWPVRALMLVHCVAAFAVAWIVADDDRRWIRWGIVVFASVAFIGELAVAKLTPLDAWSPEPSATYDCLSRATDGGVLELPYGAPEDHVFRQRQHGRPIFGGMFDDNPVFSPVGQRAFRESSHAFKALQQWASEGMGPPFRKSALSELEGIGIRYIVLDGEAIDGASGSRGRKMRSLRFKFRDWLGAPVADDGRFVLYAPFGGGSPCDGG